MTSFDEIVDVIVVGSGSAALSAALTAAKSGKTVLVLEKTAYLGGTSAMSGAGTWVPANHHMLAAGIEDSPENALRYLRATARDGWQQDEDALWKAFADNAPKMLAFLEANTPLKFEMIDEPDIFAERAGGVEYGRMLSTRPIRRTVAAGLRRHIRRPPWPQIFSYNEAQSLNFFRKPVQSAIAFAPRFVRRYLLDERAQGNALIAGLLAGCQVAGCRFYRETPAQAPILDETGRVVGVRASQGGKELRLGARLGVVLASGGFEWNTAWRERYFPGPYDRSGSPNGNVGDGQRIAQEAGAALARMDQANVYPTIPTTYEGRLQGLPMTIQADPHAIAVNAEGKRFASEYDFNFFEALDARDPNTGAPVNLPVWLVADSRSFATLPVFRYFARQQKDWLIEADSIKALADKMKVPADLLIQTVERFNTFCQNGKDEDFQRGEGFWERHKSGARRGIPGNPALGGISAAPFYAVPFNRSILGTKGGARTDEHGRVCRDDGSVIPGLFAAGLTMANPIGTRAIGPGTTIGPCLTWGYICGTYIAGGQPVSMSAEN
ncbi:FAD-dependent oxidoreductase [Devosia sp.]|uniref:FAD-dependent oxidoreductase n=1 Tax=Devosia sp. TaxID=1871048 RepID=UPI002AFEE07E|nr:FAD-dependent oxidoreductase [Devosia sp.]